MPGYNYTFPSLYQNILLPFRAQKRMEMMKQGPRSRVVLPVGAQYFDVVWDTTGWDTSIICDNVPLVVLHNWNTSVSIMPIPPNTDFRAGFRVVFGAGVPPNINAEMSWTVKVNP